MLIQTTFTHPWLLTGTWWKDEDPFLSQVVAPVDDLDLGFVRDHHLRVTNGTAEDVYIESLMRMSNALAHRVTQRSLQTQTWSLTMDRFPSGSLPIKLPRPPVQSVTSIDYVDDNGDTQTLAASPADFQVGKGMVAPLSGESWPSTQDGALAGVTITYVAGYGTTLDIPADITHGRLLMIGEMYKQRSDSVIGNGLTMTPALERANTLWLRHRKHG